MFDLWFFCTVLAAIWFGFVGGYALRDQIAFDAAQQESGER